MCVMLYSSRFESDFFFLSSWDVDGSASSLFQQQKVDSLSSSLSWCHSRQVDLSTWLSCWCCFTWNCLGVWFLSTSSFHWAIPVELSLFSPLLVVVMLLMMMLHEIMGGTVIRSLVDLKRREWEERESLWDKQVLRDVHESDEIERKMENRWSFHAFTIFIFGCLWLFTTTEREKVVGNKFRIIIINTSKTQEE